MDDIRLIVEVENYQELYDPQNTYYKDNRKKEKAWEAVALALGVDADECKRRWKVLRDSFVKSKKQKNLPSGSAGGSIKEWKYEKPMSFLLPYVQPRSSRSTLQPLEEAMDLTALEAEPQSVSRPGSPVPSLQRATTPTQPFTTQRAPTPTQPFTTQRAPTPTPPLTGQRSTATTPHPRVHALIAESSAQERRPSRERRRASIAQQTTEQQLLDLIRQPALNAPPHVPNQDEEMLYFAMSLVPRLNRLSHRSQTQAQIYILKYLDQLEQSQEEHHSTPAPPFLPRASPHQQHSQSAFQPYQSTPFYQQGHSPQHSAPPPRARQTRPFLEELEDPSLPTEHQYT